MKANLLVATVGLALAASSTLASEAPASRAAVKAEYQQALHAGKLHCNDWYDEMASRPARGTDETRSDVVAQARSYGALRKQLKGPLRDRSYNPYQTEILSWRSDVHTRGEMKESVLKARDQHALRPAGEAAEIG